MEEIEGQIAGSVRFIHQGYTYYNDRNIYRCALRSSTQCQGRAIISLNGDVTITHLHNHAPQPFIIERHRMRQELIRLSVETLTPLRQIFDEVSLRQADGVAVGLAYNSVRSTMERARARARPQTPNNLHELAERLTLYALTASIYRGLVTAADRSHAIIFASAVMLHILNDATILYADGTFRIVPHRPNVLQLYTVHIRVMDIGFAAVYVLFERRTAALYTAVWRRILELAPGLRQHAVEVMGDFERAAITGIREALPGVAVRGCWFHFIQAVLRRWSRLGLNAAPNDLVNMAMGLALVPAQRFEEGLVALNEVADAYADRHPNVLEFLRYIRRQWFPLAPVLSVYGASLRTDNICETHHRRTAARLGGTHPSIWVFIENLVRLTRSEDLDLQRVDQGRVIRRPMRRLQRFEDARIRDAQSRLDSGRYSMAEYLRAVVNVDRGAELQQIVRIAEVDANDEIPLANINDLHPLIRPQVDADAPAPVRVVRRGGRRRLPRAAIEDVIEPGPIRNRNRGRRRIARNIPVIPAVVAQPVAVELAGHHIHPAVAEAVGDIFQPVAVAIVAVQPAPAEAVRLEAIPLEAAVDETAAVEAVPLEAAIVETVAVEAAIVETQAVEAAALETAAEAAAVETVALETAAIEAAVVETAAIEAAVVETAAIEAAVVETATVEAAVLETDAAETVPLELPVSPLTDGDNGSSAVLNNAPRPPQDEPSEILRPLGGNVDTDSPWECVGCNRRDRLIVLVPCGHNHLCEPCFNKLYRRSCPFCQNAIEDIIPLL